MKFPGSIALFISPRNLTGGGSFVLFLTFLAKKRASNR